MRITGVLRWGKCDVFERLSKRITGVLRWGKCDGKPVDAGLFNDEGARVDANTDSVSGPLGCGCMSWPDYPPM